MSIYTILIGGVSPFFIFITMIRKILHIHSASQSWRVETLDAERLDKDPRENYFALSGETLCQYLLRKDRSALVIARGPTPFLTGNKSTVGYISPQTGLPHYSFVGGRSAVQLLNIGVDALCFSDAPEASPAMERYLVISGRLPDITVEFMPAKNLPTGQRSAYYWLLQNAVNVPELESSIFTVGEGARYGYRSANLAVEAVFHAGRGGAGIAFAKYVAALVLKGERVDISDYFAGTGKGVTNPEFALTPLFEKACHRLTSKSGGTISKLYATGANSKGKNTLPAGNATRLGYEMADLGSPKILEATRDGQLGCQWCQVDCRHYHWVAADYAPEGRDKFLDDFEPAFAVYAMLGLRPDDDTFDGRIRFLKKADETINMEIEQMGCDIMDIGMGLAALADGVATHKIPAQEVPEFMRSSPVLGDFEAFYRAAQMLRSGEAASFPALGLVGNGPQGLADAYPEMKDSVFTGGKNTIGNAGHCNTLWTFLMPFSRYFGHYVGQYYKIDEQLPREDATADELALFATRVVRRLLRREFFWLIGNALSHCGFTYIVFSEDMKGEELRRDELLVRLLRDYGINTTNANLVLFAQTFWAQSMDFKCQCGWTPPSVDDFPQRIFEALSKVNGRTIEELKSMMRLLIDEWNKQAGNIMRGAGYEPVWEAKRAVY
ncbi:MAG: hypothetical protein GF398_14710 [Chitinivibrionales bacterium]|nr:hypothetical protein [Chitinivibrionales bacterium]